MLHPLLLSILYVHVLSSSCLLTEGNPLHLLFIQDPQKHV